MRHPVSAFLIKLVSTVAAVAFIAYFYSPIWGTMNMVHVLVLGLVVAVIGFVTDLIITKATNNIVAVYVDIAVTTLVIYFGNYLFWNMQVTWTFAFLVGLLVGAIELVLHYTVVRGAN
ncbi:MAG: DUF2512 family protein, partial [Tumebacillaceae bacterium]